MRTRTIRILLSDGLLVELLSTDKPLGDSTLTLLTASMMGDFQLWATNGQVEHAFRAAWDAGAQPGVLRKRHEMVRRLIRTIPGDNLALEECLQVDSPTGSLGNQLTISMAKRIKAQVIIIAEDEDRGLWPEAPQQESVKRAAPVMTPAEFIEMMSRRYGIDYELADI